jgi:putative ABC transport system permease protein
MFENYIKVAFKVMLRQKFFTGVSLFGISFTIMIFSISTGLFDLAYGNSAPAVNRSRSLYMTGYIPFEQSNGQRTSIGTDSMFYAELNKSKYIEHMCVYVDGDTRTFRNGKLINFKTVYTNEQLWNIYNYKFIEGRPYNKRDVVEGNAYAVITESIKRFYFGDESALGKQIRQDPKFTVIGVVKDAVLLNAVGPEAAGIFIPLNEKTVGRSSYKSIILMKDKKDSTYIKAEVTKITKKTVTYSVLSGKKVKLKEAFKDIQKDLGSTFLILSVFLFFIVVIPALNLVGLSMNRIAERSSEIGIRKAFGASSSVLAGQFIVENIIITLIGGILGVLFTYLASDLLLDVVFLDAPESVSSVRNFLINWRTIAYSFISILFFGLLSGILPAWRMSRLPAVKALKGGSSL